MNWKRVISGVLAAAMLFALPVQLLVSAEGTEAVGQADGWEELTTLESLDESNTFFYSKDDQTFEKITHPEKDVKTADGIVDYLGDGAVAVVTDPEDAAYNAGDRGQNYAWSAVGYGDWLYVGTCYAAIGNTLSLMKSSLGDEYDDKVLAATFDALYNGTFFLTEEDGGRPKGVLVKINTKTGEETVLHADEEDGFFGLFGFTGKKTTGMFDGVLDMEGGYIKTDECMRTNIPGVFAAGDVRVTPLRQVVTACADGAIAAMQCYKYISAQK